MGEDIEHRVRRLEDRVELEDLSTKYFLASDFDDYETIAKSYAQESTFSASGFEGGSGPEGVAEMIRGARANFGTTIHTPHYSLVEFQDADHASGMVGAHVEIAVGGQSCFGAVRYEDEYVREDGAWKFRSRNMKTVHFQPWEDAGTSLTAGLPTRWPGGEPAPNDYPRK
jgi:hypothetical protein